ncbi:hypothetical protein [Miltoncostaea oceani]|uniref:hypothetical protein n=1 Tax=Miltoncostaea oceani TaxID=2843216 RepID=UPI001FE7AE62|nr:hypothetical protein [Miltoncostaea oceani]
MNRTTAPRRRLPAARLAGVAVLVAAAVALLAGWPTARAAAQEPSAPAAATPAEVALAEAYAPIVRLREQPDSCEGGVPYEPIDIDLLLGNEEVALRGPWDGTDLVAIGPEGSDLRRGLWEHHLDFPGDTLDPGCTYEEWEARLQAEGTPTTYARVVTEDGHPGRLALQYWFYYVFNDWNNKHEGDWEMIQIVFDAATPAEALERGPTEVGYSQHSSAERAAWGDEKLEVVDGTHPVVYPAAGSQANFYESRLYLMRSQAEGVGCDNTLGPSSTVRPVVRTIPTDRDAYLEAYPWLAFEGRWGERQRSFFNGPTGPNMKTQWTQPFTWAQESWRDTSFDVPAGGSVNTSATDVFCSVVAIGSEVLRQVKVNPGRSALVIGGLVVLLLWALSRTHWEPGAPLRIARRRAWGQLLTASARVMRGHPRVFLGIGLLFVPVGILITFIQWLLFRVAVFAPLVEEAGETNAFVDVLALGVGLAFTFLGFAVVQAAAARALVEIDAGRPVTALTAYRSVLGRLQPLVLALLIVVGVQVLLDLTIVLVPVAVFLLVRWSLIGVVASVEGGSPIALLRRSSALTRGHWWRVAAVVLGVTGFALLSGPVVGVLALLVTGAAFDLVNMIAALVYVTALPFAALTMAYLYFDLRVRHELSAAEVEPAGDLPPEIPATA